jgi:predicted site-specific integrase-resolvase
VNVKHINQTELSERWQISARTLERWRKEGIGPVYLKMHGRVTYREEDILAYEGGCLRKSTSEYADEGDLA